MTVQCTHKYTPNPWGYKEIEDTLNSSIDKPESKSQMFHLSHLSFYSSAYMTVFSTF